MHNAPGRRPILAPRFYRESSLDAARRVPEQCSPLEDRIMNAKRGPATELAIAHKSTLKPEHQTLLSSLLADPGMATETLETLVEHLFEEEDPRLTMALRRARAGVPTQVVAGAVQRTTASVGSLRVERGPLSTGGGSVGSLRQR
jgi:hypothetical protein